MHYFKAVKRQKYKNTILLTWIEVQVFLLPWLSSSYAQELQLVLAYAALMNKKRGPGSLRTGTWPRAEHLTGSEHSGPSYSVPWFSHFQDASATYIEMVL